MLKSCKIIPSYIIILEYGVVAPVGCPGVSRRLLWFVVYYPSVIVVVRCSRKNKKGYEQPLSGGRRPTQVAEQYDVAAAEEPPRQSENPEESRGEPQETISCCRPPIVDTLLQCRGHCKN